MAMAARRIAATSDEGGRLVRQSRPAALAFFFSSFPLLSSVYVHAVFGGGGPR